MYYSEELAPAEGQVRSLHSFLNRSAQSEPRPLSLDGGNEATEEEELPLADAESELKCSSVAFFDADSDLASIFSPGSKRREEDTKRYEDQIRSLELDIVTLMDELTAVNAAKCEADLAHKTVVDEKEQLTSESKQLRQEVREQKDTVRYAHLCF